MSLDIFRESEEVSPYEKAEEEPDEGGACCSKGYPVELNLRLHAGAVAIYRDDTGVFKVLADIDHTYGKCERGLIRNIRALKRFFDFCTMQGVRVLYIKKITTTTSP